jgi:hypothetical protein
MFFFFKLIVSVQWENIAAANYLMNLANNINFPEEKKNCMVTVYKGFGETHCFHLAVISLHRY